MPLTRPARAPETEAQPPRRLQAVRLAASAGSVDHLVDILTSDSDALVREAALTSLARLGGEAAIAALIKLVDLDDARLRNAVMETLATLGEAVINGLQPLLSDADPNVRVYALTILEQIDHPRAASVALEVALSDPNVNVCAAAVEVIASSGASAMADDLIKVPARFPEHAFLGFAVRATLQRIG